MILQKKMKGSQILKLLLFAYLLYYFNNNHLI